MPTAAPARTPTRTPTAAPEGTPTAAPTVTPTALPATPTAAPARTPTAAPAFTPTAAPAGAPTAPARAPTAAPTAAPSAPVGTPTAAPAGSPVAAPTAPAGSPVAAPTAPPAPGLTLPTAAPAGAPTAAPAASAASAPTAGPNAQPAAAAPTAPPIGSPAAAPSAAPAGASAPAPTGGPVTVPSQSSPPPSAKAAPGVGSQAPGAPSAAAPSTAPAAPLRRPPLTVQPAAASATAAPSAAPTAAVLSPEVQNPLRQQIDSTLTGVAVASMAVGPAPGLASLALLSKTCVEDSDVYGGLTHNELPIVLHPLRFRVAGDVYLGCVVAGFAVGVGACYLHVFVRRVVAPIVTRLGGDPIKLEAGLLQPGASIFVMLFLYQGVTYATAHLLLRRRDSDAPRELFGVASLVAVVVGFPAMLWAVLLRQAPSKMTYEIDPQRGRVRDFILGPGEWCSLQKRWHERFAVAVWPYRRPTAAVFALLAKTAALSVTSAAEKHTPADCAAHHLMLALIVLGYSLFAMCGHYARPRDAACEAAVGAMAGTAMLARSAAYLSDGDGAARTFAASSVLLLLSAAVLAVRTALSLAANAYVASVRLPCGCAAGGRRALLQLEVERADREAAAALVVGSELVAGDVDSQSHSSAATEPAHLERIVPVTGRGRRPSPEPLTPLVAPLRPAGVCAAAQTRVRRATIASGVSGRKRSAAGRSEPMLVTRSHTLGQGKLAQTRRTVRTLRLATASRSDGPAA
eukprot:TRINITY_DN4043_c0_g1_i14.p1 TRINITY_DN4043_c0_g1~~TRINITY_DN4043_c0_g1_i14.p1  ORF type:complete len:778 (+),score=211.71 TRINITY_DN4043_c0_g1_i14:107-2335(+)